MDAARWRTIERLYHAAHAVPAEQRASFLADACAGDEAVRLEVQRLLNAPVTGEGFLERGEVETSVGAPLLTGQRVGVYVVEERIGAGGMGEVYRARDTRLGRDVAIKVLPRALTTDPERLARFEREARILAALNHPNIGSIYGLEESHADSGYSVRGLVLELIDGETLAQRIARGPIAIGEALAIASQIADALDAAHEKGVVHRDLKPANIKITPAGLVKVLDFGLAKAVAPGGVVDGPRVASLTFDGTREGVILGTAAYMSPEQARGQAVDKRSDIWALGCVLYEMLTGRAAFIGETVSDTIAAVLDREPEWAALPAATPPPVQILLQRMLQKDPRRRLRDIGDAAIELTAATESSGTPVHMDGNRARRGIRRRSAAWVAASVVLAGMLGGVVWNLRESAPDGSAAVSRIAIALPPGQLLARIAAGPSVAVSPDGTRLAYVASEPGRGQHIFLRPLEGLQAMRVPGTEGGAAPFFSPDGQWVGFYHDGKLKKVSITTGTVVTLAEAGDARGASWAADTVVFVPTRGSRLRRVSDEGGATEPLTQFGATENSHRWPELLPDAKILLFAGFRSGSNWEHAKIAMQSLDTGERFDLIEGGSHPRYTPTGHLVYIRGQTLLAAPLDIERRTVTGPTVPVIHGVLLTSPVNGMAQYSFSNNGTLVYLPATGQAFQRSLVWVSRDGTEEPLNAPHRPYRNPRISPDGRRLAVAVDEQQMHVWLFDLARGTLSRFTADEKTSNYNPVWTPDGQRIIYQSINSSGSSLFSQPVDGGSSAERVCCDNGPAGGISSVSPDGQLFAAGGASGASGDLWTVQRGIRSAEILAQTTFAEGAAMFSPDGRWLAYSSNETGRAEIYVQAFPPPGGKWQISTDGGTEPMWNRNGRELFYRRGNRMMAVGITTLPTFSAGKPQLLFEGVYEPTLVTNANYDVSPDGQRFLMLKATAPQEEALTQINVVLNWFEELRRLVPAK